MRSTDDSASDLPPPSRAPRSGLMLMGLILAAMVLLSIYSNLQKARRGTIETVTITPASSASPTPSPAAPTQ